MSYLSGCCSSHLGVIQGPDGKPQFNPVTGNVLCVDGTESPTCTIFGYFRLMRGNQPEQTETQRLLRDTFPDGEADIEKVSVWMPDVMLNVYHTLEEYHDTLEFEDYLAAEEALRLYIMACDALLLTADPDAQPLSLQCERVPDRALNFLAESIQGMKRDYVNSGNASRNEFSTDMISSLKGYLESYFNQSYTQLGMLLAMTEENPQQVLPWHRGLIIALQVLRGMDDLEQDPEIVQKIRLQLVPIDQESDDAVGIQKSGGEEFVNTRITYSQLSVLRQGGFCEFNIDQGKIESVCLTDAGKELAKYI
ncbi:hypothetical protein GF357_02820 [Candidatus Dojkabacteria bacterium]|nr:hypothetical protein [Candidatus Dojkabacteria bacterium]